MGDPKKIRKKYETPSHPWQKARIDEEKVLSKEYGLKNKKEIWKIGSVLKNFKDQAKKLVAMIGRQAELEKEQLKNKVISLGLIESGASLDKILGLTIKDVLDRRLQTVICKTGLARSVNQARQFIVHGHIKVDQKKITAPSYLIKVKEEGLISFVEKSSLANPEHPERYSEPKAKPVIQEKETKKVDKKTEKKSAKKIVEEVAAFDEIPTEEEVVRGDAK
ncbi:MAG: 30S ribosomal protein S4 [Nanoarchaeota archaeon]|nr:30S ribosomal protein S4 [Nanoarchaeota archaeon]MBU1030099.1 30S ribosomal protein S4 [Nanoarchaeota archaeon]MBU1849939.1 30S ribosomal protein S4 [Nanoarchaeota archaeon]